MKKILTYALPCLFFMALCSCERVEIAPIGEWDPIEVSQSEVVFGAEGGSCTIKCKNYAGWSVQSIRIGIDSFCYHYTYGKLDPAVSYDGLHVEKGPEKNMVTITAEPSQDHHFWYVDMCVGDTGRTIPVKQN